MQGRHSVLAAALAAGLILVLSGCVTGKGDAQVTTRPVAIQSPGDGQGGNQVPGKSNATPTPTGSAGPGSPAVTSSPVNPPVSTVQVTGLEEVNLDKLVLALTPGQPLVRKTGALCGYGGDVQPAQGGENSYEDLAQSARKGLAGSGIPIPGSNSLFDTASQAPFILRGRATNVDFGYCAFWYTTELEGSLTVNWELFSLLEQRVVYQGSSRGSAKVSGGTPSEAGLVGINRAIEQAAGRLGSDPQFRAALVKQAPGPKTSASAVAGPITLAKRPLFTGSFQSHAGLVTQATVLLRAGGHGSGFFISADGLILTNAHVVQGQTQIRVELQDGSVLTGQVLRSDSQRDVALVQVPLTNAVALPLDRALPQVSEEVFASGAPLDSAFTGTITKGIVSALRREPDGLLYIQADVDVQPGNSGGPLLDASGNVIGVTVFGVQPAGGSIGLNFFIPIDQALAALSLFQQ